MNDDAWKNEVVAPLAWGVGIVAVALGSTLARKLGHLEGDTVTQLAAVTSALDRAGFAIIASAMQQCIEGREPSAGSASEADEPPTLEQLEKLFLSLA